MDDARLEQDLERQPNEDWKVYVRRLEELRMNAVADHKDIEAKALDKAADLQEYEDEKIDPIENNSVRELRTAARAKKASAKEYRASLENINRRSKSG
jgi:hypothetical protein